MWFEFNRICKDNNDKAFSDCLTPQEKTNAEINAELQISDVSCEEGSQSAQPNSKKPDQTIFTSNNDYIFKSLNICYRSYAIFIF